LFLGLNVSFGIRIEAVALHKGYVCSRNSLLKRVPTHK
jgi:hypothetical protein